MAPSGENTPFEKLGRELMAAMPDGVTASLMMQYSEALPMKQIWRAGPNEQGGGGDGKRVLGLCFKRQRSVLIHDAEKDTQMRGIKTHSLLSALCVPVFDEDKSLLGALLLASDKPGTFTKEHRPVMERFAREFGPLIASLRRLPEQEQDGGSGPPGFLFSRPFQFSLSFALVLLVMWSFAPTRVKPPEEATTTPIQELSNDLGERADAFLQNLRSDRYEEAWSSLDSSLKARWPATDFAAEMTDWVGRGDNKEILDKRRISTLQKHYKKAQVILLESAVQGDRGHWTWEFVEDGGDWRLTRMDGPLKSPD